MQDVIRNVFSVRTYADYAPPGSQADDLEKAIPENVPERKEAVCGNVDTYCANHNIVEQPPRRDSATLQGRNAPALCDDASIDHASLFELDEHLGVAVRDIDLLESCVLLAVSAAKRVEEIPPFSKVVDSCDRAIQVLQGLV